MNKILVSGLINIEITLQIEGFPLPYFPVRYPFFGVNSTVSGVGYNVAKALTVLGDRVNFLSIVGKDLAGSMVKETLENDKIDGKYVLYMIDHTAHSVILYDKEGRRQINVDLKDIQEQTYPKEIFLEALEGCSLASICNINFSRPFLNIAKEKGILIATDVHAISSPDDEYNRDFMEKARILFMSDELLPCRPEEWASLLHNKFGTEIIVIGMGKEGALLSVKKDNFMERIPAVYTRKIINTIGAGDALFSSFIHFYNKTGNPYDSIKKAMVFASFKIGEKGAAQGFLDEKALNELCMSIS